MYGIWAKSSFCIDNSNKSGVLRLLKHCFRVCLTVLSDVITGKVGLIFHASGHVRLLSHSSWPIRGADSTPRRTKKEGVKTTQLGHQLHLPQAAGRESGELILILECGVLFDSEGPGLLRNTQLFLCRKPRPDSASTSACNTNTSSINISIAGLV